MVLIYAIIILTFAITHTTIAAKEEETENRAHIPYQAFGGIDSPQTYHFGYDSKAKDAPRLMREEKRHSDGTVTGRYGYTDPFGVFRVVKYVSGNGGYYASEEIGDYVTSSTPQYYKATAPQLEGVSEEPINYSADLATKFNPPLYHPEAHTMAPYERPTSGEPRDTTGITDDKKSHGIFSLSNSEDILERKYRERKQLEREMRTSQDQSPNRDNSAAKQTIDKRVGQLTPNHETSDTIRTNIDRNIDNRDIIEPFVDNNSYNDLLRRTGLQKQTVNYNRLIGNNYTDIATKSNISNLSSSHNHTIVHIVNNRNSTFNVTDGVTSSTAFTASPITPTPTPRAQPVGDRQPAAANWTDPDRAPDPQSDAQSHLYYNPTRSPATSYTTSVSKDMKNKSESDSQTSLWTQFRERFLYGSSSTEQPVPTTTTETPTTTTLPTDDNRDNSTDVDIFSPIFIRVDPDDFHKAIPIDLTENQEPKYFDKNYFFAESSRTNEKKEIDNKTDIKSNDTNVWTQVDHRIEINRKSNSTDNNTNINDEQGKGKVEKLVKKNWWDETSSYKPVLDFETTRYFVEQTTTTETPRTTELPITTALTGLSGKQHDNSTREKTKSGFFQDFWLTPALDDNNDNNDNNETTEPTLPFFTELQTSVEYSPAIKLTENNQISNNTKQESTRDPTNRKIIEDFWQKFDEKFILFSEAQVENQKQSANASNRSDNSSNVWSLEDIDRKSIMISEGIIIEPIEPLQATTQSPTTGADTTTARPEVTTTTATTNSVTTTGVDITASTDPTESRAPFTTTQLPTTKSETATESVTTTPSEQLSDSFWHQFTDEKLDNIVNQTESNDTINSISLVLMVSSDNTTDNNSTSSPVSELDSTSMDNKSNVSAVANKALPLVETSDRTQSIPPLSAIFRFPHSRKRVRKVQRLRSAQEVMDEKQPNMVRVDDMTTTIVPNEAETETDVLSTDAAEEMTDLDSADDDIDSALSLTASQRVYHYIPPFHINRETFVNKNFRGDRFKGRRPKQYSIQFDDMSEIMSSIRAMKKMTADKEHKSNASDSNGERVKFDDQPDSFMRPPTAGPSLAVPNRPQLPFGNRFHSYLLPLEPQRDEQIITKSLENSKIKRNIYNLKKFLRYEPIIKN